MANFVAIAYDDMFKAQEVRLTLLKLQQEYLICMEDAVVDVPNLTPDINVAAAEAVVAGRAHYFDRGAHPTQSARYP